MDGRRHWRDQKAGYNNINFMEMVRAEILEKIKKNPFFDIIIIGGGATGIGSALEASLRGYRTLLVEKSDFIQGTSSRSTKLVHGGIRYLAQGNIFLVFEALRERGYLKRNAPHLVRNQMFVIPNYSWWEAPFYTIGLKIYDLMSGFLSMGSSFHVSGKKVRAIMPGIKDKKLRGGVVYHDGQFDDARLAMDLLHSLFENDGMALNYFPARNILKDLKGVTIGIIAEDRLSGKQYNLFSASVINATGVWAEDILKMDNPGIRKLIMPSQGIHLVISKKFLPGQYALMIPKTDDGRVLFAVPWHDHIIVGTTDTVIEHVPEEPKALENEISFILDTTARYFKVPPLRKDVLSVFAGLRPLAAPRKSTSKTREISRSHKIYVSQSKLITIIGGKWTTYRKMAEEVINKAARISGLKKVKSVSKRYKISGYTNDINESDHLSIYGTRRKDILELIEKDPTLNERLHTDLNYLKAEIVWFCRQELVIRLEDILARRTRALFLNAYATREIIPVVADIMTKELGWTEEKKQDEIRSFHELISDYILE